MKKGVKFDYKQAYNKNLKPSARLHYLENARHDQDSPAKKYGSPMKMGSPSIHKHMGESALFNYAHDRELEEDMPVDKDATGGRSTANSKIQAGKKLKQEGRAQKKSERKVKSLDRKAKRAERAEASGNTKKADRLKRSAQRKKDRIARKNK